MQRRTLNVVGVAALLVWLLIAGYFLVSLVASVLALPPHIDKVSGAIPPFVNGRFVMPSSVPGPGQHPILVNRNFVMLAP